MKVLILMVLAACVVVMMTWTVNAQQNPCQTTNCGKNEECHLVRDCNGCTPVARCLTGKEFRTSDVGCLNAKPLLDYDSRAGSYYHLSCSERLPCPISSYYCSIEGRQSIEGRVCCPANPAISKTGSCPALTQFKSADCVDACLSDGDCSSNKKCCQQSIVCTKKMCQDV